MKILKPPRLRRGDAIGLISPASTPLPPEKIEKGARYLEGLGYRVKLGQYVAAQHGYFAGTDAERLSDLNAMLNDPQVKAIFAVRGGYGSPRLLPFVDYRAARRQPKIVVGFSDITALQLALFKRTGLVTFSGPLPGVEFWRKPDPYTEEHFWRLLTSSRRVGPLPNPSNQPLRPRIPGRAEGRLLGGNLSLLVSNLGTPFSPDYRGALLVLEDVGENFHRIDRMFTQLRNAGILNQLKGLVLGQFTNCEASDPAKPHLKLNEIIDEVLSWLNVPVVEGFQYGHVARKLTLPIGLRARLDAGRGTMTVLEPAVE
jgi:muramoyltetrapeptide carboxypeptidase